MADLWMDVDAALAKVPLNLLPLLDSTTGKDIEAALTFDQAGLALLWNFVTTAGVQTQTAVTPTEAAGDYDWSNLGNGMYAIEMPASGGASANNDTEGFGWFTGVATGVLPWRGPVIGFRAAALNNALIDGGDLLDVNMTHVADTAQTANDNGADINEILTDTAELGAAVGASLSADIAAVQSVVDAITAAGPTKVEMDAAIAALENLSAAEVNAEVLDVLATDTHAEPGQGAPAATTTVLLMLQYLYKALRNKVEQTESELRIYNDAGDTIDQLATVSDADGTATKGEIGSGA